MTSSFFYEFENIYNLRNLDNQIIVCTEMNTGLANQVGMQSYMAHRLEYLISVVFNLTLKQLGLRLDTVRSFFVKSTRFICSLFFAQN